MVSSKKKILYHNSSCIIMLTWVTGPHFSVVPMQSLEALKEKNVFILKK